MGQHARLSPSNHRWVHCPGSIREEEPYPNVAGDAAIDGTGTHILLEMMVESVINKKGDVTSIEGQTIGVGHDDKPEGWLVDKERIDRVMVCIEYLIRRTAELKSEYPGCEVSIETETKSNPGKYFGRDDWWGTVDLTIRASRNGNLKFIEVVDYKDGIGYVSQIDNPQLTAYLIGKMIEYNSVDLPNIDANMTIVQPKLEPQVRSHSQSIEELHDSASSLFFAAELTDDPNAPLISDDKNGKGYCNFCKHKMNCPTLSQSLLKGVKMFKEVTPVENKTYAETIRERFNDLTKVTPEVLSDLLSTKEATEELFKRVTAEAQKRISDGQGVPGYEMLPGRSSKQWSVSEEEVVKQLRSCRVLKGDIYTTKLITPVQALKLDKVTSVQRKRIEEKYIKTIPGSLRLKPVKFEKKNVLDDFKDVVIKPPVPSFL